MNLRSFLYRQKQRLNYHFASSDVERQIAEINKYFQKIKVSGSYYFFEEIEMSLPKGKFDYIFQNYSLFVSNAKNLSGNYSIEDNQLLFSWDNFKVHISSPSELFIINEIFVEKCYNFILPPTTKVNVIDIGMNVGLASLFFASHPQVRKVFAYEPFTTTFDLALHNFDLNPQLKIKIHHHNYGLGKKDGIIQVPFNDKNLGVNTISSNNPRIASAKSVSNVKIIDAAIEVDRILKETAADRFFVKIDTEGAEYEIFDRLFENGLNHRIIGFMLEWHFRGAKELEEKMVNEGFNLFSSVINKNAGIIYAIR